MTTFETQAAKDSAISSTQSALNGATITKATSYLHLLSAVERALSAFEAAQEAKHSAEFAQLNVEIATANVNETAQAKTRADGEVVAAERNKLEWQINSLLAGITEEFQLMALRQLAAAVERCTIAAAAAAAAATDAATAAATLEEANATALQAETAAQQAADASSELDNALEAARTADTQAGDALTAAQAAYDDAVNGTVLCFAAGTLIRTPSGNRPVEELQIGDLVLTPDGPLPLKFLGISTRHVNNLRATGRMPIRIQAGVFGDSLPSADIYCTPSHAFALGDCLVEAQALINGQSIYQLEELSEYDQRHLVEQCSPSTEQKEVAVAVAMADSFTYYSLEFDQHVLVWANDLLTESYLPTYRDGELTRVAWNNYYNYINLYGSSETMDELPIPRIPFSRQIPLRIREQFGLLSSNGPSSAGISGSSASSADAGRDKLCLTL